jgi:hypothetical protein
MFSLINYVIDNQMRYKEGGQDVRKMIVKMITRDIDALYLLIRQDPVRWCIDFTTTYTHSFYCICCQEVKSDVKSKRIKHNNGHESIYCLNHFEIRYLLALLYWN